METVIFLVILGNVVAVVLYLMRQREPTPTPVRVLPAVVEQPVAATAATAPIVETPTQFAIDLPRPAPLPIVKPRVTLPSPEPSPVQPATATAEVPKPKRARKTAASPEEPSPAAPSSVAKVLLMLKERDSLVAAFVLREIFDAPVSRRRR